MKKILSKSPSLLLIFSATFFLLTACSKTDSQNVKTEGIYPTYTVTRQANGVITCSAIFQVGGKAGTYLKLTNGDEVTCNNQNLQQESNIAISYARNMSPAKYYKIEFKRKDGTKKIATVALPEAISITNLKENSVISMGRSFKVKWKNANPNYRVLFDYNDNFFYARETLTNETVGEITMNMIPSDNESTRGKPIPEILSGKLSVERILPGTLPQGFEGGQVNGHYIQTINLIAK